MNSPIIVGGTGGSGTRLVSLILRACGVFMGLDVNYAEDSVPMNKADMFYLRQHPGYLQEELDKRLAEHLKGYVDGPWGWKHTYTYLMLPAIHYSFGSEMTFIHLVRDGRDMAYGDFVSPHLFGVGFRGVVSPEIIMALWEATNIACNRYGERFLKGNYLQVRYEDLCKYPQRLPEVLGLPCPKTIHNVVRPSKTMGRWRGKRDIDIVTRVGECGLKRFGYL